MAYHHVINNIRPTRADCDTNNIPHDGVPPCSEGISDQCYGIYCSVAWISNKYSVTDYDDKKKRKWKQRSRYPAAVCHYTCDGNEQETTGCDGEVEKLGCGNAPGRLSAIIDEEIVPRTHV